MREEEWVVRSRGRRIPSLEGGPLHKNATMMSRMLQPTSDLLGNFNFEDLPPATFARRQGMSRSLSPRRQSTPNVPQRAGSPTVMFSDDMAFADFPAAPSDIIPASLLAPVAGAEMASDLTSGMSMINSSDDILQNALGTQPENVFMTSHHTVTTSYSKTVVKKRPNGRATTTITNATTFPPNAPKQRYAADMHGPAFESPELVSSFEQDRNLSHGPASQNLPILPPKYEDIGGDRAIVTAGAQSGTLVAGCVSLDPVSSLAEGPHNNVAFTTPKVDNCTAADGEDVLSIEDQCAVKAERFRIHDPSSKDSWQEKTSI